MQTSVNLQETFNYSLLPLIVIIILAILFFYLSRRNKKKEVVEGVKVIPEKNIKNIPVIKGKYLDQLESIEYKYSNNAISIREAYQAISQTVRMFVFEITDITTQNYSLAEIKKLNIPHIYELIEEYYEPEFASKSEGDFASSVNKARGVINKWK